MMDFLLHIEQMLPTLLENYGLWIYAILFLIIFAETGSVFMFFLPGDSLLIAVGALCSTADNVHLHYMGILLIIASTLGYIVNYQTGKALGIKYFNNRSKWFKPEYIEKTYCYFAKHGGKTILVARFIPFVRSFAPFAAGSSHMKYSSFMLYNIVGGWIWISLLLGVGFGLGNLIAVVFKAF
ncbi:VTT domain-containing protein [Acinetobacter pullicarnis]|uniref:VTT domain-containing protein n=1 Tax=Acinetobacter pullicarnis TaxID=2576829 RepID=UPI00111CF34C|nr:VTT domain-containing protein [Acinetobacter pullicarnis]